MSWHFFCSPLGEGVYFPEKYDGLSKLEDIPQNWGILQTRMDQMVAHMKIKFDHFKCQNVPNS